MQNIKSITNCPCCTHSLEDRYSLLNEFWVNNETVYFCWCSNCFWKGEVKSVDEVYTSEPDGEEE